MSDQRLAPVHPGEVLLEEFLRPLGLSQNRPGLSLGVHPRRINEIVLGKRRVTAEATLCLARYFGTTLQFWLGLQAANDPDVAADDLGERLEREVQVRARASWSQKTPPSQARRASGGPLRRCHPSGV